MKRMVSENLIAILKEMDSKGVSISDLADMLENIEINEDGNLKLNTNITLNDNDLTDVNTIYFRDGTHVDTAPHLYVLSLYFSDTSFVVYTNDKGLFELGTIYDFVSDEGNYELSDELTTSLISILNKIKVGAYNGIPFIGVNDSSSFYMNNSTYDTLKIYDASETYILSVNLTRKTVSANNQENWSIKFTQII